MPETVALIVPCHDEAARLAPAEFLALARSRPDLSLVFVDDGSTDGTAGVLEAIQRAAPDRIAVLRLPANVGKGEAVRQGMVSALSAGARAVGYLDADLSTPAAEMVRVVDALDESGAGAVLGSRVRLLGRAIERRPLRHYLGRAFATLASMALRIPVYDTQCGAKVFRAGPALRAALSRPFRTRWIFDVELLERLLAGGGGARGLSQGDFLEVPLREWRDVGGSKLRARAMIGAGFQLLALVVRSRLRSRAAPERSSGPARTG